MDACIVRLVITFNGEDFAYSTVHDELWPSFQSVLLFKDIINEVLSIDFYKKLEDSDVINIRVRVNPVFSKKNTSTPYCYNIIL
jgi:hypothetical protein